MREIKEDPVRLSEYSGRAKQMRNDAEELGNDSQNEKVVVDRPTVKQPQQ